MAVNPSYLIDEDCTKAARKIGAQFKDINGLVSEFPSLVDRLTAAKCDAAKKKLDGLTDAGGSRLR